MILGLQALLKVTDELPILCLADRHWWVAYAGEHGAVAYAAIRIEEDVGWFSTCGVLTPYRGYGLQKKLIKKRLDYAKKVGVKRVYTYTVTGNHPSANSLISMGFRLCTPPEEDGGQYAGEDIDINYWRKEL